MRYLLSLLLLIFICDPAQATIVHLNGKYNLGELAMRCGGGEIEHDSKGHSCTKKNCDGKGGDCKVSCDNEDDCYGSTPKETTVPGLIDPSTLDSGMMPAAIEVPMESVTKQRLATACEKVTGAIFRSIRDDFYYCANFHCHHHQTCTVECTKLKCLAGLPEKPVAAMSLLAILQGGDGVNHETVDLPASKPAKPDPIIIP